MLSFFRRIINSRVGVIVTFGVLIVIALAFAAGDVTGLRTNGFGGMASTSVAEVGKEAIGAAELRQRAQSELQAAQQQQPTLTMPAFIQQGGLDATLDRAINGLALQEFGRRQGMVISKRAVDGQIASIPGLQGPTGGFDQATYQRLLASRRLTDRQVRDDIARDTMAQLLVLPTRGAAQVPLGVAMPYASLLLEKRAGTIGFVPSKAVAAGAAPSDAELQGWYRSHLASFTVPERRVMRYALVTPDQVKAQATPTAAEIAKAYADDRAKYQATEKRTVSQVTVLDQNAATALAARVKGGTSLDAAARAAGLEPATLTLDKAAYAAQTSPAVADAVFAAAKGNVIGPVRNTLGFVVARVDAVQQVAGKTLAEATPEITAALATAKTQEALQTVHDALDNAIANNANFGELVQDQKLAAAATPALLGNGTNPDDPAFKPTPALGQIVQAGFQSEQGDDPQLVATGNDGSFALVVLDRVVPAAPRPFAAVRDAVAADFTADRALRAARQVASTVLAKAEHGTPLKQALGETGLALPPTQPLSASRAQLAQARNGAPAPLVLLFTMAQGTTKLLEAPNRAGWLLVHLDAITKGDATRVPQIVAATRADLGRAVGGEYIEQFAAAVRQQLGVKRNAAAVAKVRADLSGGGAQDQP